MRTMLVLGCLTILVFGISASSTKAETKYGSEDKPAVPCCGDTTQEAMKKTEDEKSKKAGDADANKDKPASMGEGAMKDAEDEKSKKAGDADANKDKPASMGEGAMKEAEKEKPNKPMMTGNGPEAGKDKPAGGAPVKEGKKVMMAASGALANEEGAGSISAAKVIKE